MCWPFCWCFKDVDLVAEEPAAEGPKWYTYFNGIEWVSIPTNDAARRIQPVALPLFPSDSDHGGPAASVQQPSAQPIGPSSYPAGATSLTAANHPALGYQPGSSNNIMVAGQTSSEALAQQVTMANGIRLYEGQDIQPSDPDPHRMYYVRELDGTWIVRNRFTIDSGEIGAVRWYMGSQGEFYANRLPEQGNGA